MKNTNRTIAVIPEGIEKEIALKISEWTVGPALYKIKDLQNFLRGKYQEEIEALFKKVESLSNIDVEEIKNDLSRLAKHKGFLGISIIDGYIQIRTTPIFAFVRDAAGVKIRNKRILIGWFDITIHSESSVSIINYIQNYVDLNRPHWAANNYGSLCLGEYEPTIVGLVQKGKMYELFDLLYHFIRTAEDEAAYVRDYQWDAERLNEINPEVDALPDGTTIEEVELVLKKDFEKPKKKTQQDSPYSNTMTGIWANRVQEIQDRYYTDIETAPIGNLITQSEGSGASAPTPNAGGGSSIPPATNANPQGIINPGEIIPNPF